MNSSEIIKRLKADGWYEVNVVGSHHPIVCRFCGNKIKPIIA